VYRQPGWPPGINGDELEGGRLFRPGGTAAEQARNRGAAGAYPDRVSVGAGADEVDVHEPALLADLGRARAAADGDDVVDTQDPELEP
jgi:hypothetical protein